MPQIKNQKLYRVLDANFNRAKEGLRICEDIARFFLDSRVLSRRYKDLRHQLSDFAVSLGVLKAIEARNILRDVGKVSSVTEFKRRNVQDVFYANSQRIKESIRVLEEFSKVVNSFYAQKLKNVRYQVYDLEKKMVQKF